jgi:hypothetical protein
MLVALFNAVKVESVPLNFNFFHLRSRGECTMVGLMYPMRFNSPPNWPAPPPGWTPPPDWQPDPTWPPPPPGWPLWVPDEPPRRRTGLIVGGIVAAFAVIGIVAAVLIATLGSKTTAGPSGPTDEEQIRTVVQGFEDAWNNSDFERFKTFICDASLNNGEAPAEDEFLEQRDADGRIELTVTSVKVNGGTATATVEEMNPQQHEKKSEDLDLVHENGGWKACFS